VSASSRSVAPERLSSVAKPPSNIPLPCRTLSICCCRPESTDVAAPASPPRIRIMFCHVERFSTAVPIVFAKRPVAASMFAMWLM
jgi:hypothetical protein